MLDAVRPYGVPFRPFVASLVTCSVARDSWELAGYWSLRREIFCGEQALFASAAEERDAHDDHALPIVAIAHNAGTPDRVVGVVRIFSAGDAVWYGGRLGVERTYRLRSGTGASLIRCAVQHAIALGCRHFHAAVLRDNARYFGRFHFHAERQITLCGRPHVLMRADLLAYDDRAHHSRRSVA